jgi:hypothetical protein
VRATLTELSLVAASAAPRAAVSIASVTTKGWMRALAITSPLTRPSSAAVPTPPSSATAVPLPASFAATIPATASSAPTDRSIPPVRMTKVIPSATRPSMLFCRSTLSRFSGVPKA